MTITETVAGALTERKTEFVRSYNAGNGAGIAAQYTADAQLLPPGSEIVTGREAIAEFWTSLMRTGAVTVALETSELQVEGTLAVTAGRYVLSDRDGRDVETGKFIVVWREQAGAWWAHRDIWNTGVAAQGGDRP
jgi:ketosteroid isomerase-like protein